ncbi:hypothetical protein DOTSEDRAFT_75062 [Dothistroma septosporum NZE10]|uniref:Uncharacterized protein n=1 Tax=Dothistroma septosporum (strain NZE10 / CBS 128990) TaxID=675120 RepID=M2Y1L2_DOTSN|nr:hypothetical protein DOTSEDRAFT_75062 [Dothistroma septosporum NZE10]
MLDTTAPASRKPTESDRYYCPLFHSYVSDLARGFMARYGDKASFGIDGTSKGGLSRARLEHRLLFGLLLQHCSQDDLAELDHTSLANLNSLAELYDIIEFLAPTIRTSLLNREDIWQDVRNELKLYMTLSVKLRCESVFYDALCHLIGSGDDLSFPPANWTLILLLPSRSP